MSLSPRQLDAFLAAAELGTFSEAARRLHVTPAAISNQIAELEATLGIRLFERTTRKVALSEEGREFLPAALATQRQLNAAAHTARDIRDRRRDIVRVAAPLSLAAALLPDLIASFLRDNPGFNVRLVDAGVEWLGDRVVAGEADLAIGPDRLVGPDVTATRLSESAWVAWCAPDHPMAELAEIGWDDALRWEFYAAGRDHEHSVRPRLTGTPGELLEPTQIVANISTALGLAAAGLGYTCSPDYLAPFAAKMGLVMRPLVRPVVMRYVTLYKARGRNLSVCASSFMSHVYAAWENGLR